MTVEVPVGMELEWPLYSLWLNDKLPMRDFDLVSLDDVDLGLRALQAWNAAKSRSQ